MVKVVMTTSGVTPKKPKLWMPLAALVLIILILAGAWLWHSHKSSQNTKLKPPLATPAGWSLFRSEKDGFQFIYPSGWGTAGLSSKQENGGKSYSISFNSLAKDQASPANTRVVTVTMKSGSSKKSTCVNNICGAPTLVTSDDFKKYQSANKSKFIKSDSNSSATLAASSQTGPDAHVTSSLEYYQVVSLPKMDVSLARAYLNVIGTGGACPADKFSDSSNCVTQNDYDQISKSMQSIQGL
jgi:hypothetical protein